MKKNIRINSIQFTLLLSIYFTFILNIPIACKLISILSKSESFHFGFIISIPLLLISLFNILFVWFTWKHFEKLFFISLISITSIASYAMYYYGIIFDVGMVRNIIETNYRESTSYINGYLFIWFFFTAVLPGIIVHKIDVIHNIFLKDFFSKLLITVISTFIITIILTFYYKDYAAIGRNNRYLEKYILPINYIYSTFKYSKTQYLAHKIPYQHIGLDAKNNSFSLNGKKNLIFLVIGETARGMNYQLNGYDRPTNSYTKDLDVITFKNVTSCGTSTVVSVPCLFSSLSQKSYSEIKAKKMDNLLDILKRAGLNLLWIDNDDGCKGVCKNIANIEIKPEKNKWCDGTYCTDEVLLENLQTYINNSTGKDTVILLHLIGSHGPTYYRRYPQKHMHFKPDCPRSDIQNCSHQELVNSYDNTILYTDFVLSRIIKILKKNNSTWNSGLIYLSDHGESLGEKNLYLHGSPYIIAPKEQTNVPFIIWFSKEFYQNKIINQTCLAKNNDKAYSHDNFFHSVLGLLDISTSIYKKDLDIFYACRKNSTSNLTQSCKVA